MRIFTFGCSYTRWYWPTWADIMQRSNPEIEIVNLGKPAIGNVRIAYRVQEMHLNGTIQPDDIILINWTSWHREDRFVNGNWANQGNIFNARDFGQRFVRKYWSPTHDVIKNSSAIISTNQMFDIAYNGTMIKIGNTENYDGSLIPDGLSYSDHEEAMRVYFDNLPPIIRFPNEYNSMFSDKSTDAHPDVKCHAVFYEMIREQLSWLNPHDADWVEQTQDSISRGIHNRLRDAALYKVVLNQMEQVDPSWRKHIGFEDSQWNDPIFILS